MDPAPNHNVEDGSLTGRVSHGEASKERLNLHPPLLLPFHYGFSQHWFQIVGGFPVVVAAGGASPPHHNRGDRGGAPVVTRGNGVFSSEESTGIARRGSTDEREGEGWNLEVGGVKFSCVPDCFCRYVKCSCRPRARDNSSGRPTPSATTGEAAISLSSLSGRRGWERGRRRRRRGRRRRRKWGEEEGEEEQEAQPGTDHRHKQETPF